MPPIDDLGFVDLVTVTVRCGEARSVADCTIDISHLPAAAANQVVMIVRDSYFEAGRRPGRLNTAHQPLVRQDSESVVDRLPGDCADLGADCLGDIVCRSVGPFRHRPQNGETLSCDLKSMLAKKVGWFEGWRHTDILCQTLDYVKSFRAQVETSPRLTATIVGAVRNTRIADVHLR